MSVIIDFAASILSNHSFPAHISQFESSQLLKGAHLLVSF